MGTTAEKLQAILDSKADIKDAIEQKGVMVGGAPLSEYAQKIMDIEGGGPVEDYDVEFIDYDGELLIGMSKEEFLALEEMPANPAVHSKLISDGWNWTFEDAYAYVNKYGALVIGALYTTKNDASWVTLNLDDEALLRDVPVYFKQSVSQGTLVDWGDGTKERFTGTNYTFHRHTYSQIGTYTITLTPDDGCVLDITASDRDLNTYNQGPDLKWGMKRTHAVIGKVGTTTRVLYLGFEQLDMIIPNGVSSTLGTFRPYNIKCIVFPSSITTITANSFNNACNIRKISLGKGITTLNGSIFGNCYNLDKIVIPDTVVTANGFSYCYKAKKIIIPDSVTSVASSAFRDCHDATYIHISNLTQTIGGSAFYNCWSLEEIILPDTINNVEGSAFANCHNAKRIKLSNSMTAVKANCFINCNAVKELIIPEGITDIQNGAFQACYLLQGLNLPESLITIGSNAFTYCYDIEILTIPKNVTSIGNAAFQCYQYQNGYYNKLTELHMKPTTPPTLTQAAYSTSYSIFSFSRTADIKVYVPQGSLTAYQTATNWTMLAQYMIEEEEEE